MALDRNELLLVMDMRAAGLSWDRVAACFGRSRQAHRVQLERLCRERGLTIADLDPPRLGTQVGAADRGAGQEDGDGDDGGW